MWTAGSVMISAQRFAENSWMLSASSTGGEVSVVAAVQSTVAACLEAGGCGLGTGSVHGVSNL